MNSLGLALKNERERRGFTLEHVARETNISKTYIEALEAENYTVFPGEPYLFGFLRTYAEFLELSPEELIGIYRNHKIQEQPSPISQLVPPPVNLPWRPIVIGVGIVAVLTLAVINMGGILEFFQSVPGLLFSKQETKRETVVYSLGPSDRELDKRFYKGDRLEVDLSGNRVGIEVNAIQDYVLLVSPNNETRLRLGQEAFLDLDEDGSMDLRIGVTDLDPRSPDMGANLSLQRIEAVAAIEGGIQVPAGSEPLIVVNNPANVRPERQRPSITVQSAASAGPIQIEVSFRGRSLFRYQADDRPREEGFWDKGEVLRIEASRQVVFGASNSSAFSLRINGRDVDLNTSDQVLVRILRWIQQGVSYQLQLDPLY